MSQVQLKVMEALAKRQQQAKKRDKQLSRWDNRGVVVGVSSKGYRVKTDLGNILYVPPSNVNTNGNIINQQVVVYKPRLGQPFLDGKVSG